MPYAAFFEFYPDVAENETRVLTLLGRSEYGLPPDEYAFIEMFCDEPGCDCRRVFFHVQSEKHGNVATIAYGWESREFYVKWFGRNDKSTIDELVGPFLNLASPQSKYANALLNVVKEILLTDRAYVDRIKKHYSMVRKKINASIDNKMLSSSQNYQAGGGGNVMSFPRAPVPIVNQFRNVGRNSPCPCGSGKKFKQCCLGKV